MTWELSQRRFIRSINSKYIYGRIVSPYRAPSFFFLLSLPDGPDPIAISTGLPTL